jgi:N-carbamoylputrescine amidase
MQELRIALIQTAWTGNRATMQEQYRALIAQAVGDGAQMLCLQEFTLSPYFAGVPDDAGAYQWAEPLHGGATDAFFSALAKEHSIHIVSSLFEQAGDAYYDTALIHNPQGELAHYTRKVHIPSGEGYHETDYFGGDSAYPVHDLGAVKMSAPTCYDQWFPEMARICALNGAEFIFYPTAIGSEPTAPDFDSKEAWQTVIRGHAIANGVYIAAANRIGHENSVTFYGSSFVCDPTGNIIVQASRDQTEIIHATLSPAVREQYLALFPLMHQRKPHTYGRITQATDAPPPERWQGHHAFGDDE